MLVRSVSGATSNTGRVAVMFTTRLRMSDVISCCVVPVNTVIFELLMTLAVKLVFPGGNDGCRVAVVR